MRGKMGRQDGWNAPDEIAGTVLLVLQGFNRRGFARDQSFPNISQAASERGDPTHAGDAQTHRASLRRTIVALVPPKPNELETAQSNCASRGWFATMFRDSSACRKLIFGGKNWCCSASRLTTASIAPAAPSEWPIILFVELTGTSPNNSMIA